MRIRDFKLKLQVAAGRYVRRLADYLLEQTSQPAESAGGPPKDWLERVRRSGGPMVSHTLAEPPARLPRPPAMEPLPKRRILTKALGYPEAPVFQDTEFPPVAVPSTPQAAIEETGGISPPDDASRQMRPLPGVRQKWQRPLKPVPAQCAPPVLPRGATKTQQTSAIKPGRIQRQQEPRDGEPAQSGGTRWDGSSAIQSDEPAGLEFSGGENGDDSY